jgi:CHAT domain-containing protein/Tfp pilus assembly protein PilF
MPWGAAYSAEAASDETAAGESAAEDDAAANAPDAKPNDAGLKDAVPPAAEKPDPRRVERERRWAKAQELEEADKPAEAAAECEAVYELDLATLAEDDSQLAGDLEWIAGCYETAEDWTKAEDRRRAAWEWRSTHQGADHWETVLARIARDDTVRLKNFTADQRKRLREAREANGRAVEFWRQNKYAEARRESDASLEATEEIQGKSHYEYGSSLHMAAMIARATGDYPRAKDLYEQALAVYEAALGERHPYTATTLSSLGGVCDDMGDFQAAEDYYLRSLEIRKEVLGEHSEDYEYGLNNLGLLYLNKGQYDKAEQMLTASLAIAKERLGEDDPDYATSLNNLAGLYDNKGDQARAEELYRQSLEIRKKHKEDRPLDYSLALNNLASVLKDQGRFSEAESPSRESLSIRRQVLGDDHPIVASSLNNLGSLEEAMGRFAEAEASYRESLAICLKALGRHHPGYATTINNLAGLLKTEGKLGEAEELFREALAVRREVLGEKHPDYAASLTNLAGLLKERGDYRASLSLDQNSLKIRREALGERHPDYGASLNNVGEDYRLMGDYSRAEPLFRQALDVVVAARGKQHPDYASQLNNLGVLYSDMGDERRALVVYREALEVRRTALGPLHPDYALSLENLSQSLSKSGDMREARTLLEEALAVYEKSLGRSHVDYANCLSRLGGVYVDEENYGEAVARYRQAVDVLKQNLGDQHPDVGFVVANLAAALDREGADAEAEKAYLETLAIERATLGEDHPQYAVSLNNLGTFYEKVGRREEAGRLLRECFAARERFLASQLVAYSEQQMTDYLATMQGEYHVMLSLDAAEARPEEALGWTLARKARVFQTVCLQRRLREAARKNPELARLNDQLQARTTELTRLTMKGAGPDAENWQKEKSRLAEEVETLGVRLKGLWKEAGGEAAPEPTVEGVREKLPRDAALVEVVRYWPFNFQAKTRAEVWDRMRYVVFVCPGDPARPVAQIDVGDAEAVDALAARLAQLMESVPRELAAGAEEQDLDDEYRSTAKQLGELLFEPLAEALGDAKLIYVSPDGPLHQIPWEALADAEGRYLSERGYEFAYLTSGRDLLREVHGGGEGALVFAAPDYNATHDVRLALARADGAEPPEGEDQTTQLAVAEATTELTVRAADVRGLNWKDLPGAREEGEELREQLETYQWKPLEASFGQGALEDSLKQRYALAVKPKLLAVMTHGFFLPDQPRRFADDAGARGGFAAMRRLSQLRNVENPMLRSGLVLAGANQLDESDDVDDGWLTAAEIAEMDFRGTDLVVLSACNSGSGRIQAGQAVAGLRSAILLAGANTMIGSLFPAPDRETRQLMHDFYEALLSGQGKLSSLQAAREAMIARRRKEHGAAHPFFWSGFVLVGRPT